MENRKTNKKEVNNANLDSSDVTSVCAYLPSPHNNIEVTLTAKPPIVKS